MVLFSHIAKKVIVIGGGASGFFAAINLAKKNTGYQITIVEKTGKLLSKVKVSGGGRCNLTHHCFDNNELVKNYPRGHKELLQVFSRFSVKETINWFKEHGISLKTEEDDRMFPLSNSSQTIIDCFISLTKKFNIEIKTNCEIFGIKKENGVFAIKTSTGIITGNCVICAMGGHNKAGAYDLIKNLGHSIVSPIPSLFTLNLPNENIRKELQGISVKSAEVRIKTTGQKYNGPVLITHWGLSGPAVLKLSAFAAKELFDLNYSSEIAVNWAFPLNKPEIETTLFEYQKAKHKALPYSYAIFDLPKRLWEFLCLKSNIENNKPWAEVSKKQILNLAETIYHHIFKMEGKTTFKEEFVTCGGIDLKEIDFKTMQSKLVSGLFFCGEVINIDGITGGFNFQSAWSTAWVCAQSA